MSYAPWWRRPLMKNVGVPDTGLRSPPYTSWAIRVAPTPGSFSASTSAFIVPNVVSACREPVGERLDDRDARGARSDRVPHDPQRIAGREARRDLRIADRSSRDSYRQDRSRRYDLLTTDDGPERNFGEKTTP